jgi:CRISPR-associated endonuclease/helicase Cas3
VVVHPCEKSSDLIYGEPPGILDASWQLYQERQGELTERDLIELVESAYAGRILSEHGELVQIQTATKEEQRRLSGVLDNPHPVEEKALKTRLEKYYQVSVIPEPLAHEARNCKPWERRCFELKMPVWYVRQNKSDQYTDDLPICRMDYDEYLGGRFLKAAGQEDPACYVF